jgi:hypothetical protein
VKNQHQATKKAHKVSELSNGSQTTKDEQKLKHKQGRPNDASME